MNGEHPRPRWEVRLLTPAVEVVQGLSGADLDRALAALDQLGEDPLPPEAIPVPEVVGARVFAFPTTGFRIYYTVNARDAVVQVLAIEPLGRAASDSSLAASQR